MSLIKLKAPSAWDTVPDGLLATGDELGLDRIEDYFNGGTLDAANFATVTSGNGIAVVDSGMFLKSPVSADAAIFYCKKAIEETESGGYTLQARVGEITQNHPLLFVQQAVTPTVDTTTIMALKRIIEVFASGSGALSIYYFTPTGSLVYWNESTGLWQSASYSLGSYSVLESYESAIQWTSTQWRCILKNLTTGVTLATTAWVDWSAVRDDGVNPYWVGGGDFLTNVIAPSFAYDSFISKYKTSALVASQGVGAVGDEIEQIPITESVESGASITWRYDIGAGWVTAGAGTLAELKTALIGTSPATLDLEATFTSDGDASASFNINGGVVGGVCDYPLESDVRLLIDYDDGNLTGTAAIPIADNVRTGIPVDDTVGNYVPATESKYRDGEQYGANGIEFTGTLESEFLLPLEVLNLTTVYEVIDMATATALSTTKVAKGSKVTLRYQIKEDGVAKDITGMTFKLVVKEDDSDTTYKIELAGVIDDATTGLISFPLTSTETDQDVFYGRQDIIMFDSGEFTPLLAPDGIAFELYEGVYDV